MGSIAAYLTDDHRTCDDLFSRAENAVSRGDLAAAGDSLARFRAAIAVHFDREENVLFPAFERATGTEHGPTAVMRAEHTQIRALLDAIDAALDACDGPRASGLCESLAVLIQQHNMKEEQILYPASDASIPDAAGLIVRMQSIATA